MDDLAGLNWTSSANPATKQSPFAATPSLAPGNYTSFRSSPSLTPQSTTPSRPASTKPPTAGNLRDDGSRTSPPVAGGTNGMDSFSSLVSFGAKKSGNMGNMSLLEQQKKLQEDRLKADHLKQQKLDQQFSGLDSLGSLGVGPHGRSGTSTPARIDPEEADLLAGFSADTKVNRASHFPPPSATPPAQTPSPMPSRLTPSPQPYRSQLNNSSTVSITNDDPFSLDSFGGNLHSQRPQAPPADDDDDILGLLGKPVSEVRRKSPSPPPKPARPSRRPENVEELHSVARTPPPGKDPRDPAIAELLDMGFSVEDAKRALAQTDTGLDVRGAIDYLLNEAHGKPKPKNQGPSHRRMGEDEFAGSNRRQTREKQGSTRPTWQGQGEMQDVAAFAQEIGGNLLKSAGSLWATSKKKVTQAINDFQDDNPNDNTPKWMKEAQREQRSSSGRRQETRQTDEAMMLDMGDPRKGKPSPRSHRERMPMSREEEEFAEEQHRRQQAREERERRLESEQKPGPPVDTRRSRITREATESEQVYISPSRRRKPAAAPAPPPKPQITEGDLLFGASNSQPKASQPRASQPPQTSSPSRSSNPFSQQKPNPIPQSKPAPVPVPRVNRQIPSISQVALANSTNSRTAGTEAFKRGDYPSALTHYSSSLSPIPPSHPLHYLILTNRAIVHIKLGDSKAALEDCDAAITGIGSGKGVGETFDMGDGTTKDLKETWGKAITRKAEALEHLERWSDAAAIWSLALENGVGGASASTGKARCEKALAPKAPPKPRAVPTKKPPPRAPSKPVAAQVTQAVKRLKDANEAAERADAEKLALHDSVEARLLAWKGGKETNLRALIASLDTVLWEGSGWKKVGMHELVMPNKVKIAYMKGIAKVHPDKISQDATVEQTMLAAAVFSTLNEAWDEFKKQNNL
ncbi:hypothetical protein AOL_s00054g256 [Orbilia oligospora ATCC 24927]|uniref:UBA domain-containing protein n=1 Tax=Arthrobotrys oligospora (strain ATCC 24927 / CBS 115.81 / DSM 1491) TaxID=756982 RepID=G1X5W2_ARTOA|nr:hypothetical protein AOL_s00054g256 [Orbilia oligospora ATCC 24927]EGX51557.1 hypothetical protein AOL_s00054g256 [Orbilia oligospora ATCC 24927]